MEVLELISEILPYVLSIFATVVAFRGKKKSLTSEEIEAKAESKKQKYIAKQNKKNHIKNDFQGQDAKTCETCLEDNSTGIATF